MTDHEHGMWLCKCGLLMRQCPCIEKPQFTLHTCSHKYEKPMNDTDWEDFEDYELLEMALGFLEEAETAWAELVEEGKSKKPDNLEAWIKETKIRVGE